MLRGVSVVLIVLALASAAFGAKKKEPPERSVSGVVTDANGNPAPGAVVQLKNTKTLEIRSFIAKDTGEYIFQGLATDVDYELRAQSNGKSSATRTLSSFDTQAEAKINLQLK